MQTKSSGIDKVNFINTCLHFLQLNIFRNSHQSGQNTKKDKETSQDFFQKLYKK